MDNLSTNLMKETSWMRSGEEENKGEEGDEEEKDVEKDKKVYYYAGQEIIIEGALDSCADMTWPASALCHYLDTHREQLNLVDKAVLEIGAGTGLVSVVAALLGAWVTATDLPEVLNNLRVNLSRNTRGRCRHTPQVAPLSWDYNLDCTYPTSIYRYDYVLASDVVYHHNSLDELLATMKHFCKPGTTVIWASKARLESDLTFTERFKKAFHTSLLSDDGDVKIFMAICREDLLRESEGAKDKKNKDRLVEEKHKGNVLHEVNRENGKGKENYNVTEEPCMLEAEIGEYKKENNEFKCGEEEDMGDIVILKDDCKENEKNKPENNDSSCRTTTSGEDITGQASMRQTSAQEDRAPAWVPHVISTLIKDVYHYVGQDIIIYESIDTYGAVMWPAALALCFFLDNNRETMNLQGKTVLELGAGTGLVAIVASLLGASVTATDLPVVLSNLRANLMRNTRRRCRHMPQVAPLSWSFDLDCTYPTSIYRYDYVLASDVVYHHDFLDELLATMKHFCKPGTILIWANKVRLESDLTFIEKFKKAFHTSLLSDDGDMKIFMATCRG